MGLTRYLQELARSGNSRAAALICRRRRRQSGGMLSCTTHCQAPKQGSTPGLARTVAGCSFGTLPSLGCPPTKRWPWTPTPACCWTYHRSAPSPGFHIKINLSRHLPDDGVIHRLEWTCNPTHYDCATYTNFGDVLQQPQLLYFQVTSGSSCCVDGRRRCWELLVAGAPQRRPACTSAACGRMSSWKCCRAW